MEYHFHAIFLRMGYINRSIKWNKIENTTKKDFANSLRKTASKLFDFIMDFLFSHLTSFYLGIILLVATVNIL